MKTTKQILKRFINGVKVSLSNEGEARIILNCGGDSRKVIEKNVQEPLDEIACDWFIGNGYDGFENRPFEDEEMLQSLEEFSIEIQNYADEQLCVWISGEMKGGYFEEFYHRIPNMPGQIKELLQEYVLPNTL